MKKVDIHEVIKLKTIDKEINNQKAFADIQLDIAKQATEFEKNILPSYSLAKESALVKQALELAKQRQAILKHAHTVEIALPPIPLEQYEIAKQALEIVREQKKLHDSMLKQIAIYKSPFIAKNDRTNHPKHELPKDNNFTNVSTEHQKKQELQDVNYYQKYQLLETENKQLKELVAELQAFIDEDKPHFKPNNLEIENKKKREIKEKGRQIAIKEWENSIQQISKVDMANIVHSKLSKDESIEQKYIPTSSSISRYWLTQDITDGYIKHGRPSKKVKK